jgi:hypothetical protein
LPVERPIRKEKLILRSFTEAEFCFLTVEKKRRISKGARMTMLGRRERKWSRNLEEQNGMTGEGRGEGGKL